MSEHIPDLLTVQKTIDGLLSEHRLKGWVLDGVRYDYLSNSYTLLVSREERTIKIKILSEMIIDACTSEDPFKRRRLKAFLKDQLVEKKI